MLNFILKCCKTFLNVVKTRVISACFGHAVTNFCRVGVSPGHFAQRIGACLGLRREHYYGFRLGLDAPRVVKLFKMLLKQGNSGTNCECWGATCSSKSLLGGSGLPDEVVDAATGKVSDVVATGVAGAAKCAKMGLVRPPESRFGTTCS